MPPDLIATPRDRTPFAFLAAAVPFVLVVTLTAIYLIAPDFYLRYVLSLKEREMQAVEMITFPAAFIGGIACMIVAFRLFRLQRGGLIRGRGGACIVALIGLAAIFFAGEEVSWGQTWFGWETPEAIADRSPETNVHNYDIGIHIESLGIDIGIEIESLGSVFLILMFFGLPLAWRLRDRFNLPQSWRPAVAEWPVVVTMAVAFGFKEIKNLYKFIDPDGKDAEAGIYPDFLDQFNEIKEMLVAVGLLMYGLYRIRALCIWRSGQRDAAVSEDA